MGGGIAKRILLAPAVIIVATTVVPPVTAAFSPLSQWLTKSVPPTLATVAALDGWVTNGLPPRETADTVTADKPEGASTDVTLAAPAISSPTSSTATAQENLNVSKAPEHEVQSAAIQTEKPILASLGRTDPGNEARKSTAAPLPTEELEIADADAPGEPIILVTASPANAASLAPTPETPTVTASAPPTDETKAAGEKSEQVAEKQLHASLDTAAPQEAAREAARNDSIDLPAAKQFPSSADKVALEKHASLGPASRGGAQNTTAESSYIPPEKSRVAYDAPAAVEEPMSIGKRRYVDDTIYTGRGSPEALLEALRHMGANAKALGLPPSLWCADFMNLVLRKSGLNATGSRAARSYLDYGQKINEPRVGAIAIFTRGPNGGHIGIVRGTDGNGNPIIISGNHNNRVAEAVYSKDRVLAYVVPYDKPR